MGTRPGADTIDRILEIVSVLLDGRARSTRDFRWVAEKYKVHSKTIIRDLETISQIERLAVEITMVDNLRHFRITSNLVKAAQRDPIVMCGKCHKPKSCDQFHIDRRSLTGSQTHCIECRRKLRNEWAERNRARIKQYRVKYKRRRLMESRESQ